MGRPDAAVTVVIPNFNGRGLLDRCLAAVLAQTRPPAAVVVVDNGSTDGSDVLAEAVPGVQVVRRGGNGGFGAAANLGLRGCRTPNLAVLNSDARPAPDWLEALATGPSGPDVWAWGSVLVSPTGEVESAGDTLRPSGLSRKLFHGADVDDLPTAPYRVLAPPGAAPLLDAEHVRALGGWFEPYFLYYEDLDLAMRARLVGLEAHVVPSARVEHDLAGSSGSVPPWHLVSRSGTWCTIRTHPQLDLRIFAEFHRQELRGVRRRRITRAWARGKLAALPGTPRRFLERRAIMAAATNRDWPIVDPPEGPAS